MRAQTAIEFLMTYGWAILVIVVVGIALASLGFFSPGFWGGSKRITGFSDVGVEDFKYTTASDNLTVILWNRYGKPITLDNAWLTIGGVTYSANLTLSTCDGSLAEGQRKQCDWVFINVPDQTGTLSATLTMQFTPQTGLQVPVNSSGTISGPVS